MQKENKNTNGIGPDGDDEEYLAWLAETVRRSASLNYIGGKKMEHTAELIAQLENAVDKYESALKGASPDVLTRRPDEKNWAPVEIICHVRDVEEIYLGRYKTVLSLTDSRFQLAEADRWAEERQYLRNDAFQALSAFRSRRKDTIEFLKTLTPEHLERTGIHPTLGRKTLADLVKALAGHDTNHLDQLERALAGKA